ncbi:hypothetical protein F4824DRAFT_502395 [Ustulina deusta]|nr:hypothetical protein F4824DRAFT_502395 [Ustulina deusta]
MLLPESDDRADERSQLRRRADKATKSVMKNTEVVPVNCLLTPTEITEPGVRTTRREHEDYHNGENPGKSGVCSSVSSTIGSEDSEDKAMRTRTRRGKRRSETPSAEQSKSKPNKRRRRAEGETIHITDVHDAFIFEYPYGTSLLWAACCTSCGFWSRRDPLMFTLLP